jgi:hypothetical protein
VRYESPPRSDLPKDVEDCDLEDFGATLECCKGSPNKDSPSRRKKLFGSLRNLRSLANSHVSPSKTKQTETLHPESPVKVQVSLPDHRVCFQPSDVLGPMHDTTTHFAVACTAQL